MILSVQRYLGVDTLSNIFENVAPCNIIAFVNDISIYSRIYLFYISLIDLIIASSLSLHSTDT